MHKDKFGHRYPNSVVGHHEATSMLTLLRRKKTVQQDWPPWSCKNQQNT